MKISKKLWIIVAVLLAVVLAVVVTSVVKDGGNANENEVPTESSETVLTKPTFMYFVTNSDLENGDTKDAIEKLKEKYGDKVLFDIKNVDEDKALLESFSIVNGNTPALIMLDSSGNISNILYKTNSYNELKDAVKTAMKN